jgi:DHA1 family bicyclomycin/chloramphenicol resistance-like MFS transporter
MYSVGRILHSGFPKLERKRFMKTNSCLLQKEITTSQPEKAQRLWLACLLGLISAMGPLCTDLYLPALPLMQQSFDGATASQIQLSLTASLLGLAVGQLLMGPYSDAVGRHRPLWLSLGVFSLASVWCAFATSAWELAGVRLLQGLAGAGGIVISRAMVRDLYEGAELTRFFSLLMLVHSVAPTLAPTLGGFLLQVTNWQGIFIVLGIVGVVLTAGVWFGLKETLAEKNRVSADGRVILASFASLLGNRSFRYYVFVQGFVGGGLFAYISGSPFVLQGGFGLSAQAFGLCFAVNSLGALLTTQLVSRFNRRYSDMFLMQLSLGVSAVASVALLVVLAVGGPLWAVLGALWVMVACVGSTMTTSFSLAIQDQAKAAGSASALLGLVMFVFGAAVSPLVGLGGAALWPMGLLIALSNVAALFCGRQALRCPNSIMKTKKERKIKK